MVFEDIHANNIYIHFMCYVTFIRLLTREHVSDSNLDNARILIEYFVKRFATLYGIEKMSFNLHAHLHLVDQVARFGPLNKHSCFGFEGKIFHLKTMIDGTRYFPDQIHNQIELHIWVDNNEHIILDNMQDHRMKSYLNSLDKKENLNAIFSYKSFQLEYLNNFELKEQLLGLNFDINSNICLGKRAFFSNIIYHTEDYDSDKKNNNHIIQHLSTDNQVSFAIIIDIIASNNEFFCHVEKLDRIDWKKDTSSISQKIAEALDNFYDFFYKVRRTGQKELIDMKMIQTKCVAVKYMKHNSRNNEINFFISPIVDPKEYS
jgi:hypothetical protein